MQFITSRGFVFVVVAGIGLFGLTFMSASAQADVTWNIVGTADGQQDLIGVVTTPDPPVSCIDTPATCGVSGTMTIPPGTLGGPGTTIDLAVDPGLVYVTLSDPPGAFDEVTPAGISKAGYTCSSPDIQTMQCTFDEAEADFVLALSPFNLAFSADGAVESKNGGFKFPDGSVQTTAIAPPAIYAIGDTGPAGGLVFYVTAGGQHGLEAAPAPPGGDPSAEWCSTNSDIVGVYNIPEVYIPDGHSGAHNTPLIEAVCGATSAAAIAAAYVWPSGQTDGFLPNKEELDLMYWNLAVAGMGGFANASYWSSSELDGDLARYQFFSGAGVQAGATKSVTNRVRAVRAF